MAQGSGTGSFRSDAHCGMMQSTCVRRSGMGVNDIDVAEMSLTLLDELDDRGGFVCRNPEFTGYLKVGASYDMKVQMGLTYLARHNKQVVGFMTLAMAHLDRAEQRTLGIDTYGNIPVLAITALATDKRYERRGVGRYTVNSAILLATDMAKQVGCRAIYLNADPDAVGFYEKLKFEPLPYSPDAGGPPMYFDLVAPE